MRTLAVANLLTAVTASARTRSDTTPVAKVIELLQNLEKDTKAQGEKEKAQWKAYADFCHRQDSEKNYLIGKSVKKIEKQTAQVDLLEAEITELKSSIAELETGAKKDEEEMESSSTTRAEEHGLYKTADTDLSTAIASVKAAIEAMKESKSSTTDAKLNLRQIRNKLTPMAEAMMLVELGQKPAGYEYQSNSIIETLRDLRDMLLKKKKEADEAEFKTKSVHDSKMVSLQNQRKFRLKERDEKKALEEEKSRLKLETEQNRREEEEDQKMDEEYLAELTQTCADKKVLWEQRSATRDDELKAISEALTTLQEKVVPAHAANKKLAQVQQETAKPRSFLQVRKISATVPIQSALKVLSKSAKQIDSPRLALLVVKAGEAKDHFVKVRALITDLVDKLEADAASEADQKTFCDDEMKQATTDRDAARTKVEALTAEKTRDQAEHKKLSKDIADLSASIASLKKSLAEQRELRMAEKEENEKTIALAKEGKSGVEFAIQVLSEFYDNAFVQLKWVPPNAGRDNMTVADKDPEIFDAEYHGEQKKSKGILGLLEVIASDFSRTISQTEQDETDAETEFKNAETEIETEVGDKEKLKGEKSDRLVEVEDEITTSDNDLVEQGDVLKAVEDKFAKLHPLCVEGEETYAERVAKREKEIEALKKALAILENWQA